ncbi:MAG: succinate dehydrogenase hydrophobic membrane anchor subunit [Chloroflexi bacterium]|nr:succinate dehydrogenase hydrophobic membrane anchor subunit [Chloroflexota bacterium]
MARTTTGPTAAPLAGEGRAQRDLRIGRERPLGGAELWWWLFMRISGLLLVFLALGHVAIMHLMDGGAERIDFGFVATRWSSVFWRTWDWLMLMLALIHGVNGLRNITLDYVARPGLRFALTMATYVLALVLMVLGTVVVVTFDPSAWPGAVG